jgi:hypothetical protein
MSSEERIRRRARGPILIFGAALTLIYIVFGSGLLLFPSFMPGVPDTYRNIFAGVLLLYGIFRGWRVYSDYAG